MEQELLDHSAKKAGSIELSEAVFNTKISDASIYEAVKNILANKRQGTSSTKTRGTVNGSTKKPWKQKGTGRARAGSKKSPLWKGKGIIFGPHPRDFSYVIPKKVKRKALFSVLTKAKTENTLKVVDDIKLDSIKTKAIADIFSNISNKKRVLFVISSKDRDNYNKVRKSAANIPWLRVVNVDSIEIKDLYYAEDLIFSKSSIETINERYK